MAQNYGYNRPRVVLEESPLANFFADLPSTVLSFMQLNQQLAAQREERAWKSGEAALERDARVVELEAGRKHEESLLYLADQIEDKNIALDLFHKNRETARQIGVLPSSVQTKGGAEVSEMTTGQIQQLNDAIDTNINLYQQGLSAGNALDINTSGFIESSEADPYLERLYPEGNVPEALRKGLDAWTLDPIRRAALETERLARQISQQELLEKRKKFEFLPQHEKNKVLLEKQALERGDVDIELAGQALKKGEREINLLDASLEEATIRREQMRQALSLGELQIEAGQKELEKLTLTLDSFEFDEDVKVRDYVTRTAGEAIVGNLEAQSAIGAGIMSNVSIRNNDGTYTPIFTLLTTENADEAVDLINKSNYAKNIKQELLSLVEAYRAGKGEEMLPDYSFVLDEIGKIEKLDQYFQSWYEKNSEELGEYVIGEGYSSIEDFFEKLYEQDTKATWRFRQFAGVNENSLDVKRLLQGLEWRTTGILDNREALVDARRAKNQYRHFQALLEQAQLESLSAGMLYAEPTYTVEDTSAILAPFDLMPKRSDREVDDIFDANE